MIDYFDESLTEYIVLKITTSKNKEMLVTVVGYTSDMLYYIYKNKSNVSKINIVNIRKVECANHKDEVAFKLKKLRLPSNVGDYISYYKKYLKKQEEKSQYDFKVKMFENMFDSLYMQTPDNLLVRYLKNQKEEQNMETIDKIFLLSQSNISQRTAIKNALNNDVSIIQGPPGTGKTTTILSLLANFIMDGKNVVVVSKNNSAVDNIIEEFEKTSLPQFFLRFGRNEDYMYPLQEEITSKIEKLKQDLNGIVDNNDDLLYLQKLQQKLEVLEAEIDELIQIKNLITDLKVQKKFMNKEQEIYKFEELLTENEMKIISERNVTKNKLVQVFTYAKKHKFNLFQRLIIRYYYSIKDGDINEKFYAIYQLLKEVYIKKEIADKEAFLLKKKLEEKQKEVKRIYQEYVEVCMRVFKYYLKTKMLSGLSQRKNDNLPELAFNVYPLILTTADAFLSNFKNLINKNEKIDVIIIDEASQCDVLTGLPLLYTAKKLVVVGDEKQLSAISNLEIDTNISPQYRCSNNSFLCCIKNVFEPIEQTLEEHYRCDYHIINFCNKFYYNGNLKIYTEANSSSMEIVNDDKYKGAEKKNRSFFNDRECFTIKGLVNKDDDYFVITPYRIQGARLKEEFGNERAGTIHTFQGRGAKKVYFSTVLNNLKDCNYHIRKGHNLFIPELVNVAVSRAKEKFILVCDIKYFKKNLQFVPEMNHLIDYIKIYGEEIDDKTSCWYDYLYKNIPHYKKTPLYDNEYEEVTHASINSILEGTPYICCAKIFLTELILNESFLTHNPQIWEFIRAGAHADFSIFDTRTGKLKVVIELDGKDHDKTEQKIRDMKKDAAFKSISIPVIRIKSKEAIDNQKFINKIKNYIEIDK